MRITYTEHSLDRLQGRNISKRDIKEALKKGTKALGKCVYKNPKGNLMVIYTMAGNADFTIITAYYGN